jgi:alcohol dehydrogenase
VVIDELGVVPGVRKVPEPALPDDGAVIRVSATGICRSDWHALMGHDEDVVLPHVPGHEFAGVVEAVGSGVTRWRPGARVTAPFVNACGRCAECAEGQHQVCSRQQQPGFSYWGSFAELVVVQRADVNLVALPDDVDDVTAAALGCRLATAFRAVLDVGRVRPGEWLVVHGCGGVGLSAVMVAVAAGARVVAVDVVPGALERARQLGAHAEVAAGGRDPAQVADAVKDITGGGAHVCLDALGSQATCGASIAGLRPRGRHVQVGLLPSVLGLPAVPMHLVIAGELEVLGSHGMPAHDYPRLLALVSDGRLPADRLVARTVPLAEAGAALAALGEPPGATGGATGGVSGGPAWSGGITVTLPQT